MAGAATVWGCPGTAGLEGSGVTATLGVDGCDAGEANVLWTDRLLTAETGRATTVGCREVSLTASVTAGSLVGPVPAIAGRRVFAAVGVGIGKAGCGSGVATFIAA
jgi:hypothetical protein